MVVASAAQLFFIVRRIVSLFSGVVIAVDVPYKLCDQKIPRPYCAAYQTSFHDKMLLDSAKFTLRRRKLLVNLLPSSIPWTLADEGSEAIKMYVF